MSVRLKTLQNVECLKISYEDKELFHKSVAAENASCDK